MGIDINAKLIYGCKYQNFRGETEEVDEMLDSGELDYVSPWYMLRGMRGLLV